MVNTLQAFLKKILTTTIAAAMVVFLFGVGVSFGQTTVYQDDFSDSQGSDFTTDGLIGTSDWSVNRSGDDWGARIHNGILELTNTAGFASNSNGWVFSHVDIGDKFESSFNTTLNENTEKVSWIFNMRQIRSNPAGFNLGNYGAAFVLATDNTDVFDTDGASGYAIVLGNSSTPDPIRLVSFSDGITEIGASASTGIIIASSPLDDPTNNYMSIKVTYDPSDDSWEIFGRIDGSSSFEDPNSGTLVSVGTGTDASQTDKELNFMGGVLARSNCRKSDCVL